MTSWLGARHPCTPGSCERGTPVLLVLVSEITLHFGIKLLTEAQPYLLFSGKDLSTLLSRSLSARQRLSKTQPGSRVQGYLAHKKRPPRRTREYNPTTSNRGGCLSPTVGPDGQFSDLRFTLPGPRAPRVWSTIRLMCTRVQSFPSLKIHLLVWSRGLVVGVTIIQGYLALKKFSPPRTLQ